MTNLKKKLLIILGAILTFLLAICALCVFGRTIRDSTGDALNAALVPSPRSTREPTDTSSPTAIPVPVRAAINTPHPTVTRVPTRSVTDIPIPPTNTPMPLTATPTNTPEPPTVTPTKTPEPTETPIPSTETPKPTNTPYPAYVVGQPDGDVNLRIGPGSDYDIIGSFEIGDSLEIIGRNSDSSWWQVSTANGPAWVAASVVTAYKVDDSIPVVEAPPLPVQAPEPTATPVPTPIPTSPPASTATQLPTATSPPQPTNTPAPAAPQAACDCSGDSYNCKDFNSHNEAQACFDYCVSQGAGDIHKLDQDNDGDVCESLR